MTAALSRVIDIFCKAEPPKFPPKPDNLMEALMKFVVYEETRALRIADFVFNDRLPNADEIRELYCCNAETTATSLFNTFATLYIHNNEVQYLFKRYQVVIVGKKTIKDPPTEAVVREGLAHHGGSFEAFDAYYRHKPPAAPIKYLSHLRCSVIITLAYLNGDQEYLEAIVAEMRPAFEGAFEKILSQPLDQNVHRNEFECAVISNHIRTQICKKIGVEGFNEIYTRLNTVKYPSKIAAIQAMSVELAKLE